MDSPPRPVRKHTKLFRTAAVTAGILLGVYLGLSVFGAIAAMEVPRRTLNGETPADAGLAYEAVAFPSRGDNINLKGWFLPATGDKVIIIVHGGFENRLDAVIGTLDLASDLVREGFNILLFDQRGRGESAGRGRTLSNIERDIGGAVDFVKSKGFGARKTVLMGFCSGAAISCIFAGTEELGALILTGCFTSVHDMVVNQAVQRHIPEYITDFFFSGVQTAAGALYKYRVVNPLDVVDDVSCPVFFIHEEKDILIPSAANRQLYEASGNPADNIWEIPAAEHSYGYKANPTEYIARVTAFIEQNVE